METTRTLLEITEKAASKARALAEREGTPEAFLRVRIVAGGCSGFSYKLGFEDAPAEGDEVVEGHGLRVLIDPQSAALIEGSSLEFDEALLGGGFKVNNPRAVHECACGESFSV
jgi:iron-sulfur cluster assembly protein